MEYYLLLQRFEDNDPTYYTHDSPDSGTVGLSLDAWASLAFCKNFGYAEVTGISEMNRKTSFPFVILSTFRNFGKICRISLYKGSSGD